MRAAIRKGDRPVKKKNNSLTKSDRIGKPGKARGPVQRDAKEVMAELVTKLSQRFEPQIRKDDQRRGAAAWYPWSQPRSTDSGCGSRRQVEQLLRLGFGRGETDGGRVADRARGLCGILPVTGGSTSGHGSGDAEWSRNSCGPPVVILSRNPTPLIHAVLGITN